MKTAVIIPAYSHVDHRLAAALTAAGLVPIVQHGCSDLVRCRSALLTFALTDTDAEVIVMIDSDVVPTAADIARLVNSPKLTDTSCVSGVYRTRRGRLAFTPKDEGATFQLGAPGFVPCSSAGLGFGAVTRASLQRCADSLDECVERDDGARWWPFALPMQRGDRYIAEDGAVWTRLAETGTDLFVDLELLVGHVIATPVRPTPGKVTR